MTKIDKEGYRIIQISLLVLAVVVLAAYLCLPLAGTIAVGVFCLILWICIIRFFRIPYRELLQDDAKVYAPADGTVVVVEKTNEDEYFGDERIQVSIFMSLWNVHANWFPVGGHVKYFKHHNGNFHVAWHPKSSTDNERTTTVVESERAVILFRQIAGLLAKRIVSYAVVGKEARQNSRCGFIKFGSRVDVFLPLDAAINVKLGDKVVGTQTVIATLKEKE
ncbi:MAG TPA: phosphatidylserine decarboxylase family protein [Candidatus Avirikenella pullistercoris]|nr:phosphatidylserine decarboxylase family protein [Candidatus Avirikenella pullistercoris]